MTISKNVQIDKDGFFHFKDFAKATEAQKDLIRVINMYNVYRRASG